MSNSKRKSKKQMLMKKQNWKYIARRYPFLIPETHWYTGIKLTKKEKKETEPILSFDSGDIPDGWVMRFGHELCEELRAEFIRCRCLNTVKIMQAKEKFGELRIYLDEEPEECRAYLVIDKYSAISSFVCYRCGKMGVSKINCRGWIIPCCKDCYEKMNNGEASKYIWTDNAIYEDVILNKNNMSDIQDNDVVELIKKLEKKHISSRPDILQMRPKYRKGNL